MKIIAKNNDGEFPVLWLKRGTIRHRIEYGKEFREFFSDLEAAHYFGECIRHSLECAGKLDWSDTD